MEDNRKQPNTKLRYARELRGWSQRYVAEQVGTVEQVVSRWECGEHKPSRYFQTKLCRLFEMNAEEIGFLPVQEREKSAPQHFPSERLLIQPSLPDATQDIIEDRYGDTRSEQKKFVLAKEYQDINVIEHYLVLPATAIRLEDLLERTVLDCATRFGLLQAQSVTLIEKWYGMALFCHDLQDRLDRNIKELDGLKPLYPLETYVRSRRNFLVTLAALPAMLLVASKQAHTLLLDIEEFLPRCAASITACWHLSRGSDLDAIVSIIDSYVPTLIAAMKQVPAYRAVIADLIAQCYFLKTILAWHLEGLDVAEAYCIQAMQYSQIAGDTNLQLVSLNHHVLIAYYNKQFPKALAKSEEADALIRRSSHEHIFPIMQGRVSMYLAAIQAQQGQGEAEKTLDHAQKAVALQAASAEPVPLYADSAEASLTQWDGLTHYHLSFHNPSYAKRALTSLKTFGELEPSTRIAERFRLECLNNRTLAAIQCNELEEAIVCLQAGMQGAGALGSKQRIAEVDYAYQLMLRRWPKEPKMQTLKEPYENLFSRADIEGK